LRSDPDPAELERLTTKRDNGRWLAVVGFAMLFLGGVAYQVALGGLLMLGYGVVVSVYWGARLRKLKGDPWAYDPDLDGPRPPS
jgi:hypothetical protein